MRFAQLFTLALLATAARADTFTVVETLDGTCTITHTGTDTTQFGWCGQGGGGLGFYSNDGSLNFKVNEGVLNASDPITGFVSPVSTTDEFGASFEQIDWYTVDNVCACYTYNPLTVRFNWMIPTDGNGGYQGAVFSHEDTVLLYLDQPNAVPEPAAILLFSTALCLLALWRGRSLLQRQRHAGKNRWTRTSQSLHKTRRTACTQRIRK